MDNDAKIRAVVAKFFRVTESEVTESFLFPPERMQGSVARSTLHAALKRMAGVDLPAAFTANSFGELMRAPVVAASAAAPAVSEPLPTDGTGAIAGSDPARMGAGLTARPPVREQGGLPVDFEVGTDVESVGNLPWTGDPWTDPFYLENFTPGEIAYCLRRPEPRLSLCGLWSAKEATIKCLGGGAGLRPKQIEICHDERGKPYLRLAGEAGEAARGMDFRLSISHSGELVTAVCVYLRTKSASERGANQTSVEAVAPRTPGDGSTAPAPGSSADRAVAEAGKLSVETLAWAGLGLSALSFLLLLIHLAHR